MSGAVESIIEHRLARAVEPDRVAHGGTTSSLVVLHAVPEIWLELTQTWLYGQIVSLPKSIESHVLCQRKANLEQFPFPRIHSFDDQPKVWRAWDRTIRKLRIRRHLGHAARAARRTQPQIIHSHFGPTGWEILDVARQTGAKHVVTFYGLDVNFLPKQGWMERYQELFDRIDLVLCEGPHMGKCIAALGCPPTKIRVHHLGVDVPNIAFQPRWWRPGQRLRVFMAASFREKKGLPYAIEALGILARSIDLEATIIGGASDSPQSREEERRILESIKRSGLADRVRLLGFQSASTYMNEAREHHVFLSPSVTASNGDTEGGAPVSIIEMVASGMPVVSTTHCDVPEVIVDGETGYLAPERDPEALASRMNELLVNWSRWSEMLTLSRQRIEQQFDAMTQGRLLADHYELLNR